jgi:hypothetical protein
MILLEHDGSGRPFVHTRWCRFGHPQIRNVGRIDGFLGVRVVRKERPGGAGCELEVVSMAQNWAEPARLIVERLLLDVAADGLSGLWSLAKAAQRATLRLALDPYADPDLSMAQAAMDLGELLEELEWSDPAVVTRSVSVDLGDPPDEPVACRQVIASLLVGALELTAAALRAPAGESSTAQILMLARVVHLLTSAHLRVVGRLP